MRRVILDSQRSLFDIPDDVAYLNCAYMSPLLKSVRDAGVQGLEQKSRPWTITPPDFFDGSNSLREAFAGLVGARGTDIAIIPAASYGVSVAARNLPLARGQNVVVVEDQFPSNVYPWRERAAEAGAEIRTVTRPTGGNWTDAVLERIDGQSAIVALQQCHWTDGGLFDLKEIGAHCRAEGIGLSLDVTQSAGAMPLDVAEIQPDFLVAATYKWLMGPYSLGLLYVSERWQREGKPLEHNWIHRRGSENFARLVDYQDDYAPGAQRFDVGERSNFALVPAAAAGIRQILEWGVSNLAETIERMTADIAERARALGLDSVPREQRAGHYLGLALGGNVSDDLLARLAERQIYVSVRGASIRVTPHVYNDQNDVDRFIEALRELL